MKKVGFVGIIFFIFLPVVKAGLNVYPDQTPLLTNCGFKIVEILRDTCGNSISGATITYNITRSDTQPDPSTLTFPSTQVLIETAPGIYEANEIADWYQGTYWVTTKIEMENFPITYNSTSFEVSPDYPFLDFFTYSGVVDSLLINYSTSYQPNSCDPYREFSLYCFMNDDTSITSSVYNEVAGPETHLATINNPPYNLTQDGDKTESVENKVSCYVWDTAHPWLNFISNSTFRPIRFKAFIPSVRGELGEEIKLPISVQNLGLLPDNYKITVTPESAVESYVLIKGGDVTTETIIGDYWYGINETTTVEVSILPTKAEESRVWVNITSKLSGISYLVSIPIITQVVSAPALNLVDIIILILLSTCLFFLGRRK